MKRPIGVMVLAVLHFACAGLYVASLVNLLLVGSRIAGDNGREAAAAGIDPLRNFLAGQPLLGWGLLLGYGALVSVVLVAVFFFVLLGTGLWKLKNWARVVDIVFLSFQFVLVLLRPGVWYWKLVPVSALVYLCLPPVGKAFTPGAEPGKKRRPLAIAFGVVGVTAAIVVLTRWSFGHAREKMLEPQRRMFAESSACSQVRSLNIALSAYDKKYSAGYADVLEKLGQPAQGEPDINHADLFDPRRSLLGDRMRLFRESVPQPTGPNGFVNRGYVLTYTPGQPSAENKILTYTITATPVAYGSTGTASVYSDQSYMLRTTRENRAARPSDPTVLNCSTFDAETKP